MSRATRRCRGSSHRAPTWKPGDAIDFRIADADKRAIAYKRDLCWVCGRALGLTRCVVVGPMCLVTGVERRAADAPRLRRMERLPLPVPVAPADEALAAPARGRAGTRPRDRAQSRRRARRLYPRPPRDRGDAGWRLSVPPAAQVEPPRSSCAPACRRPTTRSSTRSSAAFRRSSRSRATADRKK